MVGCQLYWPSWELCFDASIQSGGFRSPMTPLRGTSFVGLPRWFPGRFHDSALN
jgi:hypothetical protein